MKRITVHKDWNPWTMTADFALLEIDCIDFTEEIRPVCLPRDDGDDYVGANATVTGWGSTESGYSADVLKEVEVSVISNVACQRQYRGTVHKITDYMLCAWAPGKDSCQGDSGGEIVKNKLLLSMGNMRRFKHIRK